MPHLAQLSCMPPSTPESATVLTVPQDIFSFWNQTRPQKHFKHVCITLGSVNMRQCLLLCQGLLDHLNCGYTHSQGSTEVTQQYLPLLCVRCRMLSVDSWQRNLFILLARATKHTWPHSLTSYFSETRVTSPASETYTVGFAVSHSYKILQLRALGS